ncbi:MAG: CpsD/CapB family tyrosine-protein kinase [Ruminococcaceae bacterium]|nr:CpsD/CapB family tyrosine-protein kinase [Oscillospiraceae bacterium]
METIKVNLPGENDFFTEEAYKVLRTNLQFCGQDLKTIAITSCHENEGKSIISLHIAKSFAELGKKVLVIDADMRKSVIAGRNTTVKNPQGLSEVLTGMSNISDCIYQVEGNKKMHVLFAGKYPPNPVELLGCKYFSSLITELYKLYDYIIFDTTPIGRVIDAAVVAEKCDGVIMVISDNNVKLKQAKEAITQIEKSGSKLLGVVMNNRSRSNRKYYKKYHSRYYAYSSKDEEAK